MNKRKKVRILYKSGNSIDIICDELSVEWSRPSGEVTALRWMNANPEPLMAGLVNIEAIYEL